MADLHHLQRLALLELGDAGELEPAGATALRMLPLLSVVATTKATGWLAGDVSRASNLAPWF